MRDADVVEKIACGFPVGVDFVLALPYLPVVKVLASREVGLEGPPPSQDR
jgi:hypothetical protein